MPWSCESWGHLDLLLHGSRFRRDSWRSPGSDRTISFHESESCRTASRKLAALSSTCRAPKSLANSAVAAITQQRIGHLTACLKLPSLVRTVGTAESFVLPCYVLALVDRQQKVAENEFDEGKGQCPSRSESTNQPRTGSCGNAEIHFSTPASAFQAILCLVARYWIAQPARFLWGTDTTRLSQDR